MMKNVRVYDYFLDNIDCSYKMRYFLISLTRTYIYNTSSNDNIYYRKKTVVPRKIFLVGKEKVFKCREISFKRFNYKKYNMNNIIDLLYEYISKKRVKINNNRYDYDIAKMNSKSQDVIDSSIRKDYEEEVVSMQFDNKKISKKKKFEFKNIFWINKYRDYGKGINKQY